MTVRKLSIASTAQEGGVVGDAPARPRAGHQVLARILAATTHGTRLTPLVAAEARSSPPYRGLPGMEPKQPNPPKTTASSARPPAAAATPAHRPRPSTPTNCKNPELQGLAPSTSSAAPPFPTSITPSPAPRRGFCKMRARSFARGCVHASAL